MELQAICVYASSSNAVAPVYLAAAEALGREIAARELTLVYGAGDLGLMGAVARGAKHNGGRVIGVIPQMLTDKGIGFDLADELLVARDLRERKAWMEARADAFVALPGGFGTLEELLEILTLRQLQQHTKPVVLFDAAGFYQPLVTVFEHLYREHFAKPYRELYHLAEDVPDIFAYLEAYIPFTPPPKWLKA